VHTRTGLTFADGLRSIADHDPDVVMVGDMGDQETAGMTVRTALTGHLVLSTLHTNDASSAVTRLLDLGIEPFFLCQTLSGILAQRLVRKLCVACREPSDVEASSLVPMGIAVPKRSGAVRLWRPKGCKRCRQTGYHGRTGVFELLAVDHHVRSLIIKRTSGSQIRQSAMSRGMISLAQAFWQKVATGDTSLAELSRILPPELR
jgi:type II secretory ATPase GspE/PulE/Tfp pilus assembly ATPase PilB-like protein